MVQRILFCPTCKEYTLGNLCKKCGGNTREVKPPKYSPEDKYGEYRRKYKKQMDLE
jgi:H/ACA ribonucleoprotein complex subunit 3